MTIAPGLFDTPLLAALPEEHRAGARRRDPLPLPPRPARGVRAAGRRDRRQPDAERRDDPPRRRPADAAEVGVRASTSGLSRPSASGSRQTACARAARSRSAAAAARGDRLERDQVDAAAGGEAAAAVDAGSVAGVAAAGDEQQAGLRAPAVRRRGRRPLRSTSLSGPMPASEPQLAALGAVVVAVVGGGALVDLAVRADPDLDPLPVVARGSPSRRRSGRRGRSPSRRSRVQYWM